MVEVRWDIDARKDTVKVTLRIGRQIAVQATGAVIADTVRDAVAQAKEMVETILARTEKINIFAEKPDENQIPRTAGEGDE